LETTVRVRTDSADETRAVAAALAPLLRASDLLILSGDLGGGKTAFVQGLAVAMDISDPVTSPTFVLAQTYEGSLRLHHLDVYRLDSSAEVIDLSLPELLADDAVTAIEWGEKILPQLPAQYLQIRFGLGPIELSPDVRILELEAVGAAWQSRAEPIASAVAQWKETL
jgi:tRNA threonylcarbamoyladenosine biosynthesis protein TsaE